jgi:hypothetical protein
MEEEVSSMTRKEFIKKLEADKNARETRWSQGSNAETEYHNAVRVEQLKKEFGIK